MPPLNAAAEIPEAGSGPPFTQHTAAPPAWRPARRARAPRPPPRRAPPLSPHHSRTHEPRRLRRQSGNRSERGRAGMWECCRSAAVRVLGKCSGVLGAAAAPPPLRSHNALPLDLSRRRPMLAAATSSAPAQYTGSNGSHLRQHLLGAPNTHNEVAAAVLQRRPQLAQCTGNEGRAIGPRFVKAARRLAAVGGWRRVGRKAAAPSARPFGPLPGASPPLLGASLPPCCPIVPRAPGHTLGGQSSTPAPARSQPHWR
jgi:hypothetical protein